MGSLIPLPPSREYLALISCGSENPEDREEQTRWSSKRHHHMSKANVFLQSSIETPALHVIIFVATVINITETTAIS